MTDITTYNTGDIIATVIIGGFFLLIIAVVITMIVNSGKKNNKQKASGADTNTRIEELEKRVEQLENKR
ncbi:hypothetical protein [Planococcus sp. ISL-109]|uniref:hypothetical protein n=1 Tax=Planococcus sp. ISL-109 TaxID=2819166 RepID=UPI001BEB3D4B|nr:hypothetical protein [Planococcus sp. ISL-109]MBT2583328.1 hypothetical protein [Planococcus sp. ISL-109]